VAALAAAFVLGAVCLWLVSNNRPSHGGSPTKLVPVRIERSTDTEHRLDSYDAFFSPLDLVEAQSSWGLLIFVPRHGQPRRNSALSGVSEVDLIAWDGSACPVLLSPADLATTSDLPTVVPIDFVQIVNWRTVDFSLMVLRIPNQQTPPASSGATR
jgi:hypothetical protein